MGGLSCEHLIDIQDLSVDDIFLILDTAESFKEINQRPIKKTPTLRGRTIVNLFFEPSTRTRTSFEIAAKRLSADAINMSPSTSSTVKGESLVDTAQTLSAMACDAVVIRHRYAGAPRILAEHMNTHVINGGDGKHQHPTQALLDLSTIRSHFGKFEGLRVVIVGDILHSRVCGSLIPALHMLGAQVMVVAPGTLLPARVDILGASVAGSLDEVLPWADVVYMLRVQNERLEGAPFPSIREYSRLYGLNDKRASLMKEGSIIMHPGPVNRGVELSGDIVDSSQSLILDQVSAGVAVRMAVMYLLIGGSQQ